MTGNPLVLNNFMQMQQPQRNQSRKSGNGGTSATGNRRRITNESPDLYKMAGNQSLNPV